MRVLTLFSWGGVSEDSLHSVRPCCGHVAPLAGSANAKLMPEGAAVVDPRAVGEQTKLEQLDGGLSVAQVQHEQGTADEKHQQIGGYWKKDGRRCG